MIRNAPLLRDGTPMPTRFWLVDPEARRAVDRLESAGGVRRAESEIGPEAIAEAHRLYAAERDAAIPEGWSGPQPAGGVGGTRRGIKCLHAHYAWYLAGGPDPVGRWVAERLAAAAGRGPLDAGVDGPPGAAGRPSGPGGGPDGVSAAVSEGSPAAAIDCGTNSTRLLVAHPGGPAIERLMQITRLGEGVDRTGRLAPAAIERTLAVLGRYREVMDRLGVGRLRMTATSAARDAANREDFFGPAAELVGVRPELLSGEEEGCLSFAGATAELVAAGERGPWLVVDIGGGSTELAFGPGAGGAPAQVRSIDVGCVRLSERFLTCDPPRPDQLAAAGAEVGRLIEAAIAEQPGLAGGGELVGLAGTVACLAGVDQGLEVYDRARLHHYRLRRERVEAMLARLAATDSAGRRAIPGVEEGRADVIVGGTIVLVELMRRLGYDECLTSEADILDGLVLSTASRPGGPGVPTV